MKHLLLTFSVIVFFAVQLYSQSFDLVWETKKVFKTPESVLFDAERGQIYVSNINGKPSVKDNNGFISLLDTTGRIRKLKWVGGMNAPKGMARIGNLLYVTDIDRIVIINITQDRIVKTVDVEGAVFLNDIEAVSPNKLIVSDTRKNQLLEFDGDKATLWLEGDSLISPNGLAFFNHSLFVGTENNLLKVNPETKRIRVLIEDTGPIDGLIPLGKNHFVLSDWAGRIMIASLNEKIVLQATNEQKIQAADLGFLPHQNIVLIPTFFDNRIVARKLP
jgi:DNA-binding beta-propeller fold protein YncE